MVWAAKKTGEEQIERREEGYFTDEMKKRIEEEIIVRYEQRRGAMLPVLHMIEEEYGCVPFQAMEEIGEFLGVAAADVLDTVTFYEEFHLEGEKRGRYLIQMCQSVSCELCGQVELLEKLEAKLGVKTGDEGKATTDDGKVTLECVECLGSCGSGPAVLVNGKLYEHVTWKILEGVIDGLE